MRRLARLLAASAMIVLSACSREQPSDEHLAGETEALPAAGNSMVGGAEMFKDKPIAENASAAPNLATLTAAVKQAGLVETLTEPGPYTVFAPTDDAFGKLPKATLSKLMTPAGKSDLKKVLSYHMVPGKLTAAELVYRIKRGKGNTKLKTLSGEDLTLTLEGTTIKVAGNGGSMANVGQADVMQSNGIVHVVDGVLTPKL